MFKLAKQPRRSSSLPSVALLIPILGSLGACAPLDQAQRAPTVPAAHVASAGGPTGSTWGFATASAEPSAPASWGFGTAPAAQPAEPVLWGFSTVPADQPAEPTLSGFLVPGERAPAAPPARDAVAVKRSPAGRARH